MSVVLFLLSLAVADEPTVTRTYAMRQAFTSQMRNPNPFSNEEWSSTRTYTWQLVQWSQTGTAVTYRETTCGVATNKVFGAEAVYGEGFLRATPVRERTATLAGAEPGSSFRAGPYAAPLGVKLNDPMRDALPRDPKDPRLVDADGDGHPGVTVTISHPLVGTGHVYVAQRSIARLEGKLQADGSISGVIYTAPDMFKIDADTWWLRRDSPQRQHPDPSQSPFHLTPVADGTTCAQVLAQKSSLFPAF